MPSAASASAPRSLRSRASCAAAANVSRAVGSPARSSAAPSASRMSSRGSTSAAPVVLRCLLVGERVGGLLGRGSAYATAFSLRASAK